MSKYSKKTIVDYVWGNDIEGYDIEELEDDCEFMIRVIDYTNDEKMYDMCSDRVKNTYEFVRFMVNKFKYDIDFVCKIADNYLNSSKNQFDRLELLITLSDLVDKESEYFFKYKLSLEVAYSLERIKIEGVRQSPEADRILDVVQMGFFIIIDDYNSSDIIMKYFAKKFMEEIMINLEKRIHIEFDSFDELEKVGINNYLLNLLFINDSNLAAYVGCHLELLDGIKTDLDKIRRRWTFYNISVESKKYHAMIGAVHSYVEEHESDCFVSEIEMLYYIGNELGIAEKIAEYDDLDTKTYEDIISSFESDDCIIAMAKDMRNLGVLRYYYDIKKIMVGMLATDNGYGRVSGSKLRSESKAEIKSRNLRLIPKKSYED